ncbi:MAG TPA: hypothetical protein VEK33_04915 [Terriglobales bacterium]|nr:hypothetical protein [Terriglobales bacterium]
MIEIRRDIAQTVKPLGVALALAVLTILWLLTNVVISGSLEQVLLSGTVLMAFAVAGTILYNWRSGVYLFFVWLLFEDFLRKCLGNSMYVYFGKDVLIGVTYVALLTDPRRGPGDRLRVPFKRALGLFVLLGLAQFFNPGSPSLWYGVLGFKLYFYYVPLMFVGYALIRTELDLRRFLVVNMVLAAVISLVGILQANIGIDFLNPHSGVEIEELSHGMRSTSNGLIVVRPPSVFVSDGRFQSYLMLAFILGLGTAGFLFLRSRSRSRRSRMVVFPAVGLVALAAALCGGRTSFVFVMASCLVLPAGMLWGAPPKLGEGYRLVKAIRRSCIFVALAVASGVAIFPDVIGAHLAYYRETLMPDSEYSQTVERSWHYPVAELLKAFADSDWVTGHGIGTTSLGTQYVTRIMHVPPVHVAVESGYGNLILELGVLGPIVWLVWTSSLLYAGGKTLLTLKGTWAFPLALSVLWFAFLVLIALTWESFAAYQNFVLNAYLWLMVGIFFKLPKLVAQEAQLSLER